MNPSTLGAAMVAPSSRAPTTKPAISLPVRPSISPLCALSLSVAAPSAVEPSSLEESPLAAVKGALRVVVGRGRGPAELPLEDEVVDVDSKSY